MFFFNFSYSQYRQRQQNATCFFVHPYEPHELLKHKLLFSFILNGFDCLGPFPFIQQIFTMFKVLSLFTYH